MKRHTELSIYSAALAVISMFVAPAIFAWNGGYKDVIDLPSAPCCPPPKILMDGLYIGMGVGYDAYRARQSTSIPDDDGHQLNTNPVLGPKGWVGDFFFGYGRFFSWFYMGGELLGKVSNANTGYALTSPDTNYRVRLNVHGSYGGSLLPGIRLTSATLFYLRFGYIRTFTKSRESLTLFGIPAFGERTTKWGNGITYGLGFETVVYCDVSVRAEYTYTSYSAFTSSIGTRFSPSNNQFILSGIYHFWF